MARKLSKTGNGRAPQPAEKPSTEEIAARAYTYYDQEGRVEGHATEHWLRAESELMAERMNNGGKSSQPEAASRGRKPAMTPSRN